nr:hypothetical protein [Halorubrum rutilum]
MTSSSNQTTGRFRRPSSSKKTRPSRELPVDVLRVPVDDPRGLVAARRLLPTDGLDEIEDAWRQRPHEFVVTRDRERRRGLRRLAPFEGLDTVGTVIVELAGRLRRIKEKASRFSAGMNPTILYSNHKLLSGCFK